MHILFFTKGDAATPSSRWRVWFLAERLKNTYGYDYDVVHSISHSLWLPSLKRFLALKIIYYKLKAKNYKLIYIHKSLYPWDIILLILFAKWWWRKCLIYDLDDAEWIHSPTKSALLARHADAIVAGSHIIAEWARAFNQKSVMIPSVVDHKIYQHHQVRHAQNALPTIGWIGMGKGHFLQGNFALIRPALDQLAKEGISFRFVVIGSQHYQPLKDYFANAPFPTVFVDAINWADPESIPKIIHQWAFAVGLAPISATPFNRAKCAGKAIEYMACGVPVVASPVGENATVIGDAGLLVHNTEEWCYAIKTILSDDALRKEMGMKGQQRVKKYYSYEAVLPAYHKLFTSFPA